MNQFSDDSWFGCHGYVYPGSVLLTLGEALELKPELRILLMEEIRRSLPGMLKKTC